MDYKNSIVKTEVAAYVDDEYKQIIEYMTQKKKISKKYNFSFLEDSKESEMTLTSDFDKIDSSKKYSVLGYSPLVFLMKNSKDLNNFLTSNTKEGFLISESKIKNKETDVINCNFNKIVDTVIAGGDWSDLGGADKEIKIFCPRLDTMEGKLFREFLILSYNNGSKETNMEIEEKINNFFASPNVSQIDVMSKLSKLTSVPENELYVVFESDILQMLFSLSVTLDVSFIYPEVTVVKQVYFQGKNEILEELYELFSKGDNWGNISSISSYLYRDLCYKTERYNNFNTTYNVQGGVNTFDTK
ncbi:MAG: hypothetical protein ACI4UE_00415 [Candidatus Scatovivens sp.]